MAKPANQYIAGKQARELLAHSLPGSRRGTVRSHLQRAEQIGKSIWRRWQVGPWQWQQKHIRWYLVNMLKDLTVSTSYRYWLTIRALLYALGKFDNWYPHLQGPWIRPTGEVASLKAGRPPKLPINSYK